jgi:hypothetical protein
MRIGLVESERRRPTLWSTALIGVVFTLALAASARAGEPPTGEDEGTEVAAAVTLTPDRSGVVTPEAPFTWTGAVTTAQNQNFDPADPSTCGKDATNYCDITLVEVQPGDFFANAGGGVEFATGGANPGTDLDLYVYKSDAGGNVVAFEGASAGATDVENVSVLDASGFYLVVVVYFDATDTGYDGRAEFFRRARVPADVDDPEGLQDVLVSDPSRGFRSHSEPHLSADPTRPRILVGGSKMYNLDRDSLAEYEFKIGTYASFDRGRSWFDLGQLNTCPAADAPPSLWPLGNRCYPAEDPNLGGTGPEDATDDRGQGDLAEEYIVSDVWTDFDDEGNAYAMVLDAPPFAGSDEGNGWGMSFHRWETPSRQDIQNGTTWSDRIPINAYTTPADQASTLDDKNTFAVNNAGPDHDGQTGIIVACWGQNFDLVASARQQIVCERSTDGGRSWPDAPKPISPPQDPVLPFGPFVIGVHVVASETDPNTFYAVWLDTLTGFLDGSGLSPLWFTKTTDGAQTWEPARIVARIQQLPNIFPRQGFRNLSLPIMAAGRSGELYVTYADYRPAPYPASDEDGRQADIQIIRSLDGGATWTDPKRVNKDLSNADQFQPYVRVTRGGQVDVSFFDRRFDAPDPPNHPGNFFIDTVLARSANAGRTWKETRLTHDSWDPSINPPISPSGQFIGDYQGLVADDCFAIPFVNDTHLANDPARDPDFDDGLPRSPFQEVVSWRVPNTGEFGGGRRNCRDTDDGDDDRAVRGARVKGPNRAAAARPLSRRASRAARRPGAVRQSLKHAVVGERSPATGPATR